jgi:CMP-N,N'-diacetyllegionaminic acid synthase
VKKMTAIIPARGGSKGIPRKNIVNLNGFPLIAYTIEACRLAKRIDRIIVSTEDKEIASIAKKYGAEVPFVRPPELSTDDSRDSDFLNHFFDNIAVDTVALMRPTTPLRNPQIIDKAIKTCYNNINEMTSLRSLNAMNESPYKVYKVENNICCGFFESFKGIKNYSNLPRQLFPKSYEANGHIDIIKRETVRKGDAFGDRIYAFIVDKVVDIDSVFDLEVLKTQVNTEKDLLTKYLKDKK